LQLGAEINRTELINSFTGENAQIELRGAYLGRDKQSQDIFTRINHDQPNCQSNQLYRGVLDAGGKSAFQGKVIVARDAQKTNADQSNKNLLLSRKAEANAKPELLIYADDVKCSHGATVGELDPDQLFYLRSRGMDEVTAKGLLVEAFVAEVFDDIADENLRTAFKEKTARWLAHGVTS
jgi:Fe-S cluster assembly protein SufD